MTQKPYLSDEELQKLIETVETREMLTAPVDLMENLLKEIAPPKKSTDKVVEFRNYCFKVAVSIAAAIAILFAAPAMKAQYYKQPISLSQQQSNTAPRSREEVLESRGRFNKYGQNSSIFKDTYYITTMEDN